MSHRRGTRTLPTSLRSEIDGVSAAVRQVVTEVKRGPELRDYYHLQRAGRGALPSPAPSVGVSDPREPKGPDGNERQTKGP